MPIVTARPGWPEDRVVELSVSDTNGLEDVYKSTTFLITPKIARELAEKLLASADEVERETPR